MAKKGEGDARWIVADRSDGTNGAAARLFPKKKTPPPLLPRLTPGPPLSALCLGWAGWAAERLTGSRDRSEPVALGRDGRGGVV